MGRQHGGEPPRARAPGAKGAALAGPGLAEESRSVGKLSLGQAVLTRGHRLPVKVVLHTALPRFDPQYRAACDDGRQPMMKRMEPRA